MAVVVTPLESSLRIKVQTGTDGAGNPAYKSRNYNKVKPSASDQDTFDVAQVIESLQAYPVAQILRVDEKDLAAGA